MLEVTKDPMDFKKVKSASVEDLNKLALDLSAFIFRSKNEKRQGKLTETHLLREKKKDRARILTLISQKKIISSLVEFADEISEELKGLSEAVAQNDKIVDLDVIKEEIKELSEDLVELKSELAKESLEMSTRDLEDWTMDLASVVYELVFEVELSSLVDMTLEKSSVQADGTEKTTSEKKGKNGK